MKITKEMKESINRVRSENNFPDNFKWWETDHEVWIRLNKNTVFAVHTSGIVTKHVQHQVGELESC